MQLAEITFKLHRALVVEDGDKLACCQCRPQAICVTPVLGRRQPGLSTRGSRIDRASARWQSVSGSHSPSEASSIMRLAIISRTEGDCPSIALLYTAVNTAMASESKTAPGGNLKASVSTGGSSGRAPLAL